MYENKMYVFLFMIQENEMSLSLTHCVFYNIIYYFTAIIISRCGFAIRPKAIS